MDLRYLLERLTLKIENYKCFREAQGFDSILPINVIIGRNNSGKSSLLDLIQATTTAGWLSADHSAAMDSSTLIRGVKLERPIIDEIFPDTTDHDLYYIKIKFTSNHLGSFVEWSNRSGRVVNYRGGSHDQPQLCAIDPDMMNIVLNRCRDRFDRIFHHHHFGRILSDRDIRPEEHRDGQSDLVITPDGINATNIIHRLISDDCLPEALIEDRTLSELNRIFEPDTSFTRIRIQRKTRAQSSRHSPVSTGLYEVYLDEKGRGRIPLSMIGSGVKTILLVLIHLHIAPQIAAGRPSKCLFAFEELENNLHPALQRRLFTHLANFVRQTGSTLFLTTHSHIVVDMFSRAKDAQLIHVSQSQEEATAKRITTFVEHGNLFRDLDVRASDLLQANAVVWVEGPSDRVYFNRWVELWDPELQEGLHYQCLYSGGILIKGISFDPSDESPVAEGAPDVGEFLEALRINRNAVVIIDKDRGPGDELKEWVPRIREELERSGGMLWITAGKEIENYVPRGLIPDLLVAMNLTMRALPGQDDKFFEYIRGPRGGDRSGDKKAIADWISPRLTLGLIQDTLDLADQLEAVCSRIRDWNNMGPRPRQAETTQGA
jgi:predicted ATPase